MRKGLIWQVYQLPYFPLRFADKLILVTHASDIKTGCAECQVIE